MRHWPLIVPALAVLAACAPPSGTPASQATPTPGPTTEVVSPSPVPTATPVPSPTPTPSPTPSISPTPQPSPSQLRELSEANHGETPFPSPPPGSAYDLRTAAVRAGSGNETAFGAIDGKIYTTWSARAGVSDDVWLYVDLGSAKPVSRLDLLADASPDVMCYFNVDVSSDARAWRTVGSGSAYGSNEAPKWASVNFPAESIRYVRIKPTSWGPSWVAVWELRLIP